jgi:hypothetical protein
MIRNYELVVVAWLHFSRDIISTANSVDRESGTMELGSNFDQYNQCQVCPQGCSTLESNQHVIVSGLVLSVSQLQHYRLHFYFSFK